MSFDRRVDPELADTLNVLPVLRLPDDMGVIRSFTPPPREKSAEVRETDLYIAGADGRQMLVKRFEPIAEPDSPRPAILWTHGGGYILGHPDGEGYVCEQFVIHTGCVVFAPDYRLAPEHPYPAALEDSYAALVWLAQSAEELHVDPTRIAVGGGSAGGGLAAALALMARDRGGPGICFQMPLYPMLDHRNEAPSTREELHPAVWSRPNNGAAWQMYLGTADPSHPWASPARAEDLSGLPPAYLCVGQLDLFRDETIEYAARLMREGINVELHVHPGLYHASELFVPDAAISQRVRASYIDALARAFARTAR